MHSNRWTLAMIVAVVLLSSVWECDAGASKKDSRIICKSKIKEALSIVNSIDNRPEDLPWASYKDSEVRDAVHKFATAARNWPTEVSEDLALRNSWTDKEVDDMKKLLNEYHTSVVATPSVQILAFDDEYVDPAPKFEGNTIESKDSKSQERKRGEDEAEARSISEPSGDAMTPGLDDVAGPTDGSGDGLDGTAQDRLTRAGYVRYKRFGLSFVMPICDSCESRVVLSHKLLPEEVSTLSDECSELVKPGLDYYDYMALLLLGQKVSLRLQNEYARNLAKNFMVEAATTFWRIRTGGDILRNTLDMEVIYSPPGIIVKYDPPKDMKEVELPDGAWAFLWSWVAYELTPNGKHFDNYVNSIQGFWERKNHANIRECSLKVADEARVLAEAVPKGSSEELKRQPRMISEKLAQILNEGAVSLSSHASRLSNLSDGGSDFKDSPPKLMRGAKPASNSVNQFVKNVCERERYM